MSVLLWLKRDLRVHDHAALVAAIHQARSTNESLLALYAFEPAWLESADTSRRHIHFFYAAVLALQSTLKRLGIPMLIHHGPLRPVFETLQHIDPLTHVMSHEETGLMWSYKRDLAVQRWCAQNQVTYTEFPQNGVIRRLKSRDGWAVKWAQRMKQKQLDVPDAWPHNPAWNNHEICQLWAEIPELNSLTQSLPYDSWMEEEFPIATEDAAQTCLASFLQERVLGYSKNISSPIQAWCGCSRLSPYLSAGILSVRQVTQATGLAAQAWKSPSNTSDPATRSLALRSLRSFGARLRWHCHFMQKLEDEPELDRRSLWSGVNNLRNEQIENWSLIERTRFEAWKNGQTGYPMVDACMRCLQQTGWINFRMRSMLASFASYQLWLHWRETGLHLARLFIDYEPGIHWAQMQMQSGSTGSHTLRMYSPTKQAKEQDPEGVFIRRWVPELERVPLAYLAQPWLMGPQTQLEAGCTIGVNYPSPIVDEQSSLEHAKEVMYGLRKLSHYSKDSARIAKKHGSRKSPRRTS